jgi:hypothetical protein
MRSEKCDQRTIRPSIRAARSISFSAGCILSTIAFLKEGAPHIVWSVRLVVLLLYSGLVCTALASWAMSPNIRR